MKEVHIPCKECITYAICVAKDHLDCSILFKELEDPYVMKGLAYLTRDDITISPRQKLNINNNGEKLRAFTKQANYKSFLIERGIIT